MGYIPRDEPSVVLSEPKAPAGGVQSVHKWQRRQVVQGLTDSFTDPVSLT